MGILCNFSLRNCGWFGSGLHAVTSVDVREYPNRFAVLFPLFFVVFFIGFGVILLYLFIYLYILLAVYMLSGTGTAYYAYLLDVLGPSAVWLCSLSPLFLQCFDHLTARTSLDDICSCQWPGSLILL